MILGVLRSRERLEQRRLQEAESLAAMGKAMSGVAHDMKTPLIAIDTMRMDRVLINLIMNAVKASPEGETVTVGTYRDGSPLVVDIADCGCGIPLDHRVEIFNPFFTTKKEGTGLRLPISKKIVQAHEGHIKIVDNPEKRVTFRLMIPIA